jgi:hypothetical protein
MYDPNHPDVLTPPPSSDFPAGYQLTGWVVMKELFAGGDERFFGVFAQNTNDPNDTILAIRGTEPGEEGTDFISQLMMPFKVPGKGNVGIGWGSLYETFRVKDRRTMMDLKGTFSEQAEELLRGHGAKSVQVTGHSLGAALATLYAAEHSFTQQPTPIRSMYTFGSPMVGDDIFADAFDELGLESWRISNVQDWAPKLPFVIPIIAPYHHIRRVRSYDSHGKVKQTFKCVHDLATYLSLIDPKREPLGECKLPARARDSETV